MDPLMWLVGNRKIWKVLAKTRGEENNGKTVKKADNSTNFALHLDIQTSFKTVLLNP